MHAVNLAGIPSMTSVFPIVLRKYGTSLCADLIHRKLYVVYAVTSPFNNIKTKNKTQNGTYGSTLSTTANVASHLASPSVFFIQHE
jgi:VanZ family protein